MGAGNTAVLLKRWLSYAVLNVCNDFKTLRKVHLYGSNFLYFNLLSAPLYKDKSTNIRKEKMCAD